MWKKILCNAYFFKERVGGCTFFCGVILVVPIVFLSTYFIFLKKGLAAVLFFVVLYLLCLLYSYPHILLLAHHG
jgi:hypothetical protein